jgi:CRP-like cAMP-binding protein
VAAKKRRSWWKTAAATALQQEYWMRLLAHLSDEDQERLRRDLVPIDLGYQRRLYDADRKIECVYFIESGVASLVTIMQNGQAAEVGTIGDEGFVGIPVLLGDERTPNAVYMQVPGKGFCMSVSKFREELERSPRLRDVLLHYAHAFFNTMAQSAACAHFHSLERRCCRWLLMTLDRMPSPEFLLTHEFLAMMLGCRRAGVTEAMRTLRENGLVRYHHGEVTILDREELERRSCECYAITKAEFDRLLAPPSG